MELVAILSKGQGTWGQISGLMKKGEWSKIFILGPSYARDFTVPGIPFDFVEYNSELPLVALKADFLEKLKSRLNMDGFSEVAVSIASGEGKEHMALLSALLSVPVGIRFTALTKDGIIFM